MPINLPNEIVIYTDGGARGNPGPAAIGYVVNSGSGETIYESAHYIGETTNNVAEYTAVISSLKWIINHTHYQKTQRINYRLDSNLVVNQLNQTFKIKQPHLKNLFDHTHQFLQQIPAQVTFQYIPRTQNFRADQLLNQCLDNQLS